MSDIKNDEPVKMLFHHCVDVYKAMFVESAMVVPPLSEEIPGMLVYEGHLTKLFQKLELSVPYYTSVRKQLIKMGCIKQLRRGGGNAMSQWELITEPTEELFIASGYKPNRAVGRTAQLEQQVRGLVQRVNEHETRIEGLEYRNEKSA
jgi:hypothetical protein